MGPHDRALADLGVRTVGHAEPGEVRLAALAGKPWGRLRTLHAALTYDSHWPCQVVATRESRACWLWAPEPHTDVLIVGSKVGADLVRFRQGDPARAKRRPAESSWGIPGERPNYLFEEQISNGSEHNRPADEWVMALVETICRRFGENPPSLLPNGAQGALVVTGDDDQAYLEKYDEQQRALAGLPVTYLLHPLTRHTPGTLAAMASRQRVELGLHPDALDEPQRYAELFTEQATWFEGLTGHRALSVRNHGFLNDGYWGHLPVWLEHGVRVSANLPGVDGRVLNGSLLPARVAWEGRLTPHWSILTSIGDGVRFALGMDGPQSAQCIRDLADRIELSRLPGVIVLNLHPQNVGETREMHAVLHQLTARGFVAMTLGECVDWFDARDRACEAAA